MNRFNLKQSYISTVERQNGNGFNRTFDEDSDANYQDVPSSSSADNDGDVSAAAATRLLDEEYDRQPSSASDAEFETFLQTSYHDLLRRPLKGSLLARLISLSSRGIRQNDLRSVMEHVLFDELAPFWVGSGTTGLVYVLARWVASHSMACRLIEVYEQELLTYQDELRFISQWLDSEVTSKASVLDILKKSILSHPQLVGQLRSLLGSRFK